MHHTLTQIRHLYWRARSEAFRLCFSVWYFFCCLELFLGWLHWSLFFLFLIFCATLPIICPSRFWLGQSEAFVFSIPVLSSPVPNLSLNVDSANNVFFLTDLSFSLNLSTWTHLFYIISVITLSHDSFHWSFTITFSPMCLAESASLASWMDLAASRSPHLNDFDYLNACSADLCCIPKILSSHG